MSVTVANGVQTLIANAFPGIDDISILKSLRSSNEDNPDIYHIFPPLSTSTWPTCPSIDIDLTLDLVSNLNIEGNNLSYQLIAYK